MHGSQRLTVRLSVVLLLAACVRESHPVRPGPRVRVTLVHTFAQPAGIPRQLAFNPDSQLLAITNTTGTIQLWRVQDRQLAKRMLHDGGVTSVAFSPDGRQLASAGYAGTISVWRMDDGARIRQWPAHERTIWSVAWSPDGTLIASGGEDKRVKLWRARDGSLLRSLAGHSLNVWSVAFTADSRRVASGSFDHTVRVWRADSGVLERQFSQAKEAVVSIAISPDGEWLAGGGDDSTPRIWDLRTGRLVYELAGSDHIYSVAFSGDSQWLATAGREKGALGTLWKEVTGNRFRRSYEPTVRIWRMRDADLMAALADHKNDVTSVAFSRDGHWLATASDDKTVNLYAVTVEP